MKAQTNMQTEESVYTHRQLEVTLSDQRRKEWKQLKKELSHTDISKAEESFFEEQLEREYRKLKQDD